MSGFTLEWLRLREPLDAAARAERGIETRLRAAPRRGCLSVVDLGSGTGANLRYLAPRLGGLQEWLLVDDDARLLDAAERISADWARACGARCECTDGGIRISGARFDCRIRRQQTDLANGLDALPLAAADLVSASALLDLVGEAWLDALARRCRAAAASLLFALSYDGRVEATPPDADDPWIVDLFNRDQRRDKGLGPALGPAAAETAVGLFSAAGYDVCSEPSDWRITPLQRREQHALLTEWHDAARRAADRGAATATAPHSAEAATGDAGAIHAWRQRRAALVEQGRSALRVGHVDVLATLGAPRSPPSPRA